jgi:hypothetical protein
MADPAQYKSKQAQYPTKFGNLPKQFLACGILSSGMLQGVG